MRRREREEEKRKRLKRKEGAKEEEMKKEGEGEGKTKRKGGWGDREGWRRRNHMEFGRPEIHTHKHISSLHFITPSYTIYLTLRNMNVQLRHSVPPVQYI